MGKEEITTDIEEEVTLLVTVGKYEYRTPENIAKEFVDSAKKVGHQIFWVEVSSATSDAVTEVESERIAEDPEPIPPPPSLGPSAVPEEPF